MTQSRQWLGRYGEDRACEHLQRNGFEILDRNFHCREGELDIVARDGQTIVFVEVKTRTSNVAGHPFEAITASKLARIRRLAAEWCQRHQVNRVQVRMDAIAVLVRAGTVAIEHLKQVG